MNNPSQLVIYTDGGARGNPGPAGTGCTVEGLGEHTLKKGRYIGETTNNTAEYQAVIDALSLIESHPNFTPNMSATFHLDSKLVVHQLKGDYKIKQPHLKKLVAQIHQKLTKLNLSATFTYIPREKNQAADRLVNQALDQALSNDA